MPSRSRKNDRTDEGSSSTEYPLSDAAPAPHLPPWYDADAEMPRPATPMMALALVGVNDGVFANGHRDCASRSRRHAARPANSTIQPFANPRTGTILRSPES